MTRGAELSRAFFEATVRPIVDESFPHLGYLAARLGSGSDVLGLDDGESTDHDFGCRLTLLVDDGDADVRPEVDRVLQDRLPDTFRGWPVRFPLTWDPSPHHRVEVATVHDFARRRLGFDTRSPLPPVAWLCLTGQSILEVIGGPVFHDSTTSYRPLSADLQWYGHDLWHFTLAAGWARLSQELPLVGRTGTRGDDLGSRVIAARLARDIIHLAFLVDRAWMPYPKWTGTLLRRLPSGPDLVEVLQRAAEADGWEERQDHLRGAVGVVAQRQREVGLPVVEPAVHRFFDRPYLVADERIAARLRAEIDQPAILALPPIGSIEQWSDNVDLLTKPDRRAAATGIYGVQSAPADDTP